MAFKDLDGVEYIGDYMVGLVLLVWPRALADPDDSQASGSSSANVGGRVVADHPSAVGEGQAASSGGDLEQTHVGFADAFEAGQGVSVDGLGQSGPLDLAVLVCRRCRW